MDLERRQGDRAHLDKTFRAAHSLKGAAAMVGLAAIAEFTHGIEAVLEKIRGGSLVVDSDIITTLLEARDHLAAMVEGEAASSPILASGELTQRLTALLRGPAPAGSPPGSPAASRPGAPAGRRPPRTVEQASAPAHRPRQNAQHRQTSARFRAKNRPNQTPEPSRAKKRRKSRKSERPPASPHAARRRSTCFRRRRRRPGDLSAHTQSRPGRSAPRGQPPGRSGRAARARRSDHQHRPGSRSAARPDRSRSAAT